MDDGSVLLVEIARGTLSRVTMDGRVKRRRRPRRRPERPPRSGPTARFYVCNNGGFRWSTEIDGTHRPIGQAEDYSGGRIERVDLATGRFERLVRHRRRSRSAAARTTSCSTRRRFCFASQGARDEMDHGRRVLPVRPTAAPWAVIARTGLSPTASACRRWEHDVVRAAQTETVDGVVQALEAAGREVDALDAAARVSLRPADRAVRAVDLGAPAKAAVVADVDRAVGPIAAPFGPPPRSATTLTRPSIVTRLKVRARSRPAAPSRRPSRPGLRGTAGRWRSRGSS